MGIRSLTLKLFGICYFPLKIHQLNPKDVNADILFRNCKHGPQMLELKRLAKKVYICIYVFKVYILNTGGRYYTLSDVCEVMLLL